MKRLAAIEDKLFTERRLRLYGWGVISAYALALVWRAFRHQWAVLATGYPRCIDFGWMWLSGKFATSGQLARIFDYSAFSTAELAFFGPKNCPYFNGFDYPPTFLFFTYPLGWMPYLMALAVWVIVTFALYEAAVFAIVSRRAALVVAATPFFVAVNMDFGHTGFLSAALIGLSLAFVERRPWVSGWFLGLLTYKPHFGLLFPIALLASRNWRLVACTAVTGAVLAGTETIAFGYEGWASFVDAIAHRSSSLGPTPEAQLRLHSVFGLFHWAGAGIWLSWGAQLAVSVVVALGTWVLWAKQISNNLKAAALCAGSLMVTPYALFYDLAILSIAAAFLVKEGLVRGFLPGERAAMLICWGALFLVKLPIGPIVCTVLLVLCARRIVASWKESRVGFPDAPCGVAAAAVTLPDPSPPMPISSRPGRDRIAVGERI
jgi:arabinofuranan 3-O-arabinosyltransferase